MDQDGLSIAIFLFTLAVMISAFVQKRIALQFLVVSRLANPVGYWLVMILLALVAAETFRRAAFVGCVDC